MSTPTLEPVVGAREDTGWLDLARAVAIVAVVLVHVVAPAVNGSWVAEGGAAWWIANVTDSAGRWCVPVFVMVSPHRGPAGRVDAGVPGVPPMVAGRTSDRRGGAATSSPAHRSSSSISYTSSPGSTCSPRICGSCSGTRFAGSR